ncbi:MAG TPA: hypothetical protein PLW05_07755 [Candidatus Marinimicrobia bacterium]|nr:hypothetical protein [Candidatus Neomarinimicrobiota bacterium]HQE95742.1 hypothetical protein [Candidatus Neomarinimicrobiota bacterium]HQH56435.1 hypothetical protein [Candidatus Neomarinimicrobiota bacterium]HRS52720.1 hypothetical protein [Candidatus Neomarinimicrobiota bacterium]
MKSKRLFHLWIILTIIGILPYVINAQEKGRVGLTVKAQLIPQVGISYGISDNIQARLATYLEFSGGDFLYSTMSSLSFQIKLSSDEFLSTYIGPDVTYHGFIDEFYLGIIFGAEYKVHNKLVLFAEFGPSLGVGDGIESLSFLNTGVGVMYFFR